MNTESAQTHTLLCVAPGDVLSTTIADLRQRFAAAVDQPGTWQVLDIDLRATRMIDSVGLNLLVTVIKRAKAAGRTVTIRTAHPSVARILSFTRLDQHATIIGS